MNKINMAKSKRSLIQLLLFAFLTVSVLSFGHVSTAEAATCPQKETPIAHGKICKFNGVVTCDSGYVAQYNGAGMVCADPSTPTAIATNTGDICGGNSTVGGKTIKNDSVKTSINIGCRGKGNPIIDVTFAIIRFLTTGIGIVLVGSMIYAGIQYTMSRGEPQLTATAINRLRANMWALLLFLFGYAILNYLIPGTFLK